MKTFPAPASVKTQWSHSTVIWWANVFYIASNVNMAGTAEECFEISSRDAELSLELWVPFYSIRLVYISIFRLLNQSTLNILATLFQKPYSTGIAKSYRQWRTQEFCLKGGFNKFSWGQRAERTGIWGRWPPSQGFRSICYWVKPVFLLGCYGCIFHGTGNSAQLCKIFGISGGFWTPKPPPPLGRPLAIGGAKRKWYLFPIQDEIFCFSTEFRDEFIACCWSMHADNTALSLIKLKMLKLQMNFRD
jgi:hypothetical protein